MSLAPGTKIGRFEVREMIGSGGMGEVYRATDASLKRDIAIKLLSESFGSDESVLARFQREAELLASLSHPNIAHVHGLEDFEGRTAIAMELVDGPTLADRIAQGKLPVDEALGIAGQIADAIESAHERQIVHRDLKPANIKLRPDGLVKVLDFGISKVLVAHPVSGPGAAAMTTPAMTETGVILGTAAYMAPEQVRGRPIDQRTDIWAFGCVLFEMLTGRPAFGGEDVSSTLARVLEREPDADSLPASVPTTAREVIRLCLQKNPRDRLADIRDVKLLLAGRLTVSPTDPSNRASSRRILPIAAALATGGVIAGAIAWSVRPAQEPRPIVSFEVPLPPGQTLRGADFGTVISIARDGSSLAINADGGLFIRSLADAAIRLIPGTEELLAQPIVAPDGESVAYTAAEGPIWLASVDGELRFPLPGSQALFNGGSWGPDGDIYLGAPEGIYRLHPTEGNPRLVISARPGERIDDPQLLPDGDTLLFGVADLANQSNSHIVAESIATGERTTLTERGSNPRYAPTGHLLYVAGTTLFGAVFDVERLAVEGPSVPLVQGLLRPGGPGSAYFGPNYAIADNGMLAYAAGEFSALGRTLFWVDRNGTETRLGIPARGWVYSQISPDGRQVVLDARDQDNDLWIWDLEREFLRQITFGAQLDETPLWSADGNFIIYKVRRGDFSEIHRQPADGRGRVEPLTANSTREVQPSAITPDGNFVLYNPSSPPRDVWIAPIGPQAAEGRTLIGNGTSGTDINVEHNAAVSPDGRWIAYQSNETGSYEILVRPFPDVASGQQWQVSTAGGSRPAWSSDGTELFYLQPEEPGRISMMAVSYESEPTFVPRAPRKLFSGNYPLPVAGRQVYSVSTDGQRFLMYRNELTEGEDRPRIIVVVNWFDELARRVPRQ